MICFYVCFFFFFQAEDGIRDGHVTGVQTCALPILKKEPSAAHLRCGAFLRIPRLRIRPENRQISSGLRMPISVKIVCLTEKKKLVNWQKPFRPGKNTSVLISYHMETKIGPLPTREGELQRFKETKTITSAL